MFNTLTLKGRENGDYARYIPVSMPYEESDAEQDSPPWAPRRCLGKENECTIMAAHGTHGARDMDGVKDSANKSKKITKCWKSRNTERGDIAREQKV